MPIFDHFGLIAPFYERVIRTPDTNKLADLVGLPVGGWLLDAGGGTGRISQTFLNHTGGIVVADLSEKMLRQAASKPGLKSVVSHTESFPFRENTFDAVIMVDALHHVCDQPQTAMELWRVVKPGGRIVIEEPDVRTLAVKLVALGEKLAMMRSHFLSPPKIEALFRSLQAKTKMEWDGWQSWVVIYKE